MLLQKETELVFYKYYINIVIKKTKKNVQKYENYSPPPPAQQIKLCNLEWLHAVSKMRVCDCPPKQRASKYVTRNIQTVWLLVKLATFCGTIYVTKDLGMWTTSDEAERIYLRIYDTV